MRTISFVSLETHNEISKGEAFEFVNGGYVCKKSCIAICKDGSTAKLILSGNKLVKAQVNSYTSFWIPKWATE